MVALATGSSPDLWITGVLTRLVTVPEVYRDLRMSGNRNVYDY